MAHRCPVELITLSLINTVACWTQDRRLDTRGAAEPEPGPTAVPVWIMYISLLCIHVCVPYVERIKIAEPATRVFPDRKNPVASTTPQSFFIHFTLNKCCSDDLLHKNYIERKLAQANFRELLRGSMLRHCCEKTEPLQQTEVTPLSLILLLLWCFTAAGIHNVALLPPTGLILYKIKFFHTTQYLIKT